MLVSLVLLSQLPIVIASAGAGQDTSADGELGCWLWLRPGAYAVYEGVVYDVHYYSGATKVSKLVLEWRVLSVEAGGSARVFYSLALKPLGGGEPLFNRSTVVVVDCRGFMYSLNGTYLGVWTLFRPPYALVNGSRVIIADTSPVAPLSAQVGAMRGLVKEGSMYGARYLSVSPVLLPALKFNLSKERVIEVKLSLINLINESRAREIAEKLWNSSLEYEGYAKYKIRIDYKPFIEGYSEFLLESKDWLDIVTPYYYDSITGIALALRVGGFELEWLLLDDVFQYIEAYRLWDYVSKINREATVSNILSLYGYKSEEDLVRSLGYDPSEFVGKDIEGNPVLNVWLPMNTLMLVDTNVFELMREAVSSQGGSTTTTTGWPTSEATTATGGSSGPHSGIKWYLLAVAVALSIAAVLYLTYARRGAGASG